MWNLWERQSHRLTATTGTARNPDSHNISITCRQFSLLLTCSENLVDQFCSHSHSVGVFPAVFQQRYLQVSFWHRNLGRRCNIPSGFLTQFNSLRYPVYAFTAGKTGKTISQSDSVTCNYFDGLTCQWNNEISAEISQLWISWSKDTEQVGQVYIFVSTSFKTIDLRCYLPCSFQRVVN